MVTSPSEIDTGQQEKQPVAYADVRIVTGDQRAGKSNTTVKFAVDPYHEQLDGIMFPNGQIIKAKSVAKSVNPEDHQALRKMGVFPSKLRYARIFSEDGRHSKLIRIPDDCIVLSPVHIFANFHMYGIRYTYIGLEDIIEYINTDLFKDAWILADETGMTDARYSMEAEGKLGAQFYATIGKRRAHFCSISQYNEMVERRIRLFGTMRVLCSYDKETRYITCDIKERGEPSYSFYYYAPPYWRYFDSEEIMKVPQYRIDKAMQKIYKNVEAG
jgi:hypothetical protein